MKLTKVNLTGANSSLTADDAVFASIVNEPLLAQAVRVYLSNKRQGTSYTKTRGEVNRTKKKWYKQKGTGNARHGARSANIFVGGGTAHGPKGKTDWTLKLTAVLKKKAMISALSAQASKVIICDDIMNLSGKTKDAVTLLAKVAPTAGKILVVINKSEENVLKSLRNLETVLVVSASRVNTLEVVYADAIIMTSDALKEVEARVLGEVEEVKKVKRVKETKVVKEKKPVAKKASVAKPAKKVAAKKAA